MRPYLSYFKLQFSTSLQYRFAAIAGIATQFFWGFMYLMIYEAYLQSGIESPMPWNELVSYIWLNQSFLMLTSFRFSDSSISESIITRTSFL